MKMQSVKLRSKRFEQIHTELFGMNRLNSDSLRELLKLNCFSSTILIFDF